MARLRGAARVLFEAGTAGTAGQTGLQAAPMLAAGVPGNQQKRREQNGNRTGTGKEGRGRKRREE